MGGCGRWGRIPAGWPVWANGAAERPAHGLLDIQILACIVVPLAKPIMAAMLLFYAVQHWNSFFHAFIFLTEKKRYPLQLILRSVVVESTFEQMNDIGAATDFMVLEKTIRFSAIMVSTLPILLVYPFLQKIFVRGVLNSKEEVKET